MKIGGNVIDDPAALKRFLAQFAALKGPKVLVHGGGKLATRLAERLELKTQMVDGRRITDRGMLDVPIDRRRRAAHAGRIGGTGSTDGRLQGRQER